MNIIFLDIDGVIQSPRYCVAMKQDGGLLAFEPAAMAMISNLIKDFKCKVVISSSWRHGEDSYTMGRCFAIAGYKQIYKAFHPTWSTGGPAESRGLEIQNWLDDAASKKYHVSNYVIFDDDNDMLPEQASHFVQTDSNNGMLLEHYERAQKILRGEI